MKALVFGSTGFIGKHLVKTLLNSNFKVVGVSTSKENIIIHPNYKHYAIDISKEKNFLIPDNGFSCAFNLASYIPPDNSADYASECLLVNSLGTLNILKIISELKIPVLVQSSSASVYGTPVKLPVKEADCVLPTNVYAVSKLVSENYCRIFEESCDLKVVILRYSSVYGWGCGKNTVLPLFAQYARKDQNTRIYGNGLRSQDFVYVNDVVSANILAAEKKKSGVYNIGSGEETTTKSLANIIVKLLNSKSKISFNKEKRDDDFHMRLDISKAKKELGFIPEYNLERGLKNYLRTP